MNKETPFSNRLAHETSLYLKQHAHNPVDWYPWGPEALDRAKRENKPILLSIGYSACHWCHVMAHESFENQDIAALMNRHYVNIKVDREERPDLDQIYMNFVQLTTGSGGWPLTVFLTPDQVPFFGGTYFPPVQKFNHPAFPEILKKVQEFYVQNPDRIQENNRQVLEALRFRRSTSESGVRLERSSLLHALETLKNSFDHNAGGFGGAPKFPSSVVLAFMLQAGNAGEEEIAMVEKTLDAMADRGLYDHLGGGFHRYCVDSQWTVPHFEKMLYDNSLIPRIYLGACQVRQSEKYRRVVRESLDYVRREMTHPEGGFYSTQDADSEGEEGKYFVWDPKEMGQLLGPEPARILCSHFGIDEAGNFEHGKTVLAVHKLPEDLAKIFGKPLDEIRAVLDRGKQAMLAARGLRIPPGKDEKIITAWNGWMIATFLETYQVLREDGYLDAARGALSFAEKKLQTDGGGRYLRCFAEGKANHPACVDDYAAMSAAYLALFEATGEEGALDRAIGIAETALDQFWDEKDGGFFFTAKDHEFLITRPKELYEASTPSANGLFALLFIRLFYITGENRYMERAESILLSSLAAVGYQPFGAGTVMLAADFFLRGCREFVLVGDPKSDFIRTALQKIHGRYIPRKVVIPIDPKKGVPEPLRSVHGDKTEVDGLPSLYLCQNFSCQRPVNRIEDLDSVIGD